jgi:NAD(P)-dependent dehydrogenase (short-subunit alcohol dehydrogenase family)
MNGGRRGEIRISDQDERLGTHVEYQLKGKTAYVSAGAHGIGEAIADLLTDEGARVIVGDQDAEVLRDKAHKWRGTVAANLATAAGVEHAVAYVLDTFGDAPDILINNLGVGDSTPFEEISDDRWSKSIDVNLMGTVRTCRALLPRMAARASGAVVNTASDLAKQPEPAFVDYGACKAALLYLTKALAKQYAPRVRVNTVLPGPIWSRMWTRPGGIVDQLVEHYRVDRDAAVRRFLEDRQMPMGIGHPQDVAHAVVFLASPLARFITGAGLDIGGTIRGLI